MAERATRKEDELQLEAERIQVDADGAEADYRARKEAKATKLRDAARILYTVNLRAHYSILQHFVNEKIPRAIKLSQGRAARNAADVELRAKS